LDGDHYGTIHDYWGGLSDLRKGHIRVLHALSFVDDATRLLRAVRFEQRFDFQIEPRTLALMKESLPLLDKLTGARLRHEINQIQAEPKAPDMLARLDELGILQAIHPALPWNEAIRHHLEKLDASAIDPFWELPEHSNHLDLRQTLSYLLWLGKLPERILRSIASRLRFKSDLTKLLVIMSKLNHELSELVDAKPSKIVHVLEKKPRLAIYSVYLVNEEDKFRKPLETYVREWSSVEPKTTGDDLRDMGLRPSPAYGRILTALRDAWLDGKVDSIEAEKTYLAELVSEIE
jgi:tRNA nucleotidyltransferase (CCA-adding enzyme)